MNGDHNPASRELLEGRYQNGDRPNSDDFARMFASFLNILDDGIHADGIPGDKNIGIGLDNPQQKLDIDGALRVGFSEENISGSLRWNETTEQFEFNNGTSWQALSSGGGTESPWVGNPDISYQAGNVGIGTEPVAPLHINGGSDVDLNTANSGFVIIGDANAAHIALDEQEIMARNGTNTSILRLQNQGGDVRIGQSTGSNPLRLIVYGEALKPGGGSWTPLSDKRLKKNIKPYKEGLEKVLKINPVKFHYNGKAGMPSEKEYIGLVAQDLGKICPDLIHHFSAKIKETDSEETDLLSYNADGITFLMLNAIKELAARIEILENKVER